MIAAQLTEGTTDQFVIQEVPQPKAGPNDVVVKTESAGLAPGIFHLLRRGGFPILPSTPGHEIAGTVISAGALVDPRIVGQRVRVHPSLTCGKCEYCTTDRDMMCSSLSMIGHAVFGPHALPLYSEYHNGGLAEYAKVPVSNIDILPDNISFDLGAKVHDFANAIRALKLADPGPGSTLIVTAATGAMGAATISLAPAFGVGHIIAVGRNAERLHGLTAIDPQRVSVLALGEDDTPETVSQRVNAITPGGAHAAIDFFPEGPGTALMLQGIRQGGRMVHMGMNREPLQIPPAALSYRCLTFVGTRNGTRRDALQAIEILSAEPDRYARLITHEFALEDANEARRQLLSRTEAMWMSVVRP